jgi:hypothetical protein
MITGTKMISAAAAGASGCDHPPGIGCEAVAVIQWKEKSAEKGIGHP